MAIQFLPYALAALGGGARAYTAIKKEDTKVQKNQEPQD